MILDGENSGSRTSINDARDLVITAEQFKAFVDRHKGQPNLFAESSELMKDSYLLLDEEMRCVLAFPPDARSSWYGRRLTPSHFPSLLDIQSQLRRFFDLLHEKVS